MTNSSQSIYKQSKLILGQELQRVRLAQGLDYQQVQQSIGIYPLVLQNIEKGKLRRISHLAKLLKLYK